MSDTLMNVFDLTLQWAAHGIMNWSWWQVLLYTLVVTQLTIASVTLYLHRAGAHRSLDLHPVVSHFFRFWLWFTSGMQTNEWVAIHRKHHAKCETEEDPHSPMTRGIKKVLLEGSELYRAEAKNQDTLSRYSHGCPKDWVELNIYNRYQWQGVALLMILNVSLMGAIGVTVWAVQMLWIPINAAGIINGIGHYWGYRNHESADTSTNISPWGFFIGGEELHNNHHTYPTSAKFSVKPYEFDIGWTYIRILQALGLAQARKVPPKLHLGKVKAVADNETLEAIIANRYEVMARFARALKQSCTEEIEQLKAAGASKAAELERLVRAKQWLHREESSLTPEVLNELHGVCANHPHLDKLVTMRAELRQLWCRTNVNAEQLLVDLQQWFNKAEESGVAALQEFALKLRAARA
jgi:stearoyl-CoA desaturase (delta-9 desaturase)